MVEYNMLELRRNLSFVFIYVTSRVTGFWDVGVTPTEIPGEMRTSFFRWEPIDPTLMKRWTPDAPQDEAEMRRRLRVVAGLSIDLKCIGVGVILNRRTVLTAANLLEMHMDRQKEIRIWALGGAGKHNTPYRYRVWRVKRVLPLSFNPRHRHGPHRSHTSLHDIAIVHCLDQIYLSNSQNSNLLLPTKAKLRTSSLPVNPTRYFFAGSGFETLKHIEENYRIYYGGLEKTDFIECSGIIPSWWGKFICVKNAKNWAGLPNGGPLFMDEYVVGVGCFEIRNNEDRIFVFTDLKYYLDLINKTAFIKSGEYYDDAYQQWHADEDEDKEQVTVPFVPINNKKQDLFPLGK